MSFELVADIGKAFPGGTHFVDRLFVVASGSLHGLLGLVGTDCHGRLHDRMLRWDCTLLGLAPESAGRESVVRESDAPRRAVQESAASA